MPPESRRHDHQSDHPDDDDDDLSHLHGSRGRFAVDTQRGTCCHSEESVVRTIIMSSTPRVLPPAKSPALKRGDRIGDDHLRQRIGQRSLGDRSRPRSVRASGWVPPAATHHCSSSCRQASSTGTMRWHTARFPGHRANVTVATTSWMPDLASRSASLVRDLPRRTQARRARSSTTLPVNGREVGGNCG